MLAKINAWTLALHINGRACLPDAHLEGCFGRTTCSLQMCCESCGWKGRLLDCWHDYESVIVNGQVETQAVDACPQCRQKV